MKRTERSIICYTKKEFLTLQKHLFKEGFKWFSSGKNIWFPERKILWSAGVSIIKDYNDMTLTYSISSKPDITCVRYIEKYYNIEIVNFVNNIFEMEGLR